MKKMVQNILRYFAGKILRKYQPKVIGITGSIGKTSTKEAIFVALSSEFRVYKSEKNYNNELGVPLSIIGADTGGKSIFKWLGVFAHSLGLLLWRQKDYPEVLILEMGADHSGDIKYLTSFVQCDIGVITGVAPVHIEFFTTLENIAKEKGILVRSLDKTGVAVLNADDELVLGMAEGLKAKVISYGFSDKATLRAFEEKVSGQDVSGRDGVEAIRGVSFKISYAGNTVPFFLPSVVGQHSVNAALAAIAVGAALGVNLIKLAENLKNYHPPKGRMNLIDGIKYTLIIDDTYNSSPKPVMAALDVVKKVQLPTARHKYAVLGDMLELGNYTEKAHLEVGRRVAELGIDYLIAVGERSIQTANAAKAAGMNPDHVFTFDKAEEAGKFLQDRIEQGDLLLIKGSQGMRMEKVVKELMADPLKAKELLVRQEEKWL